MRTRATRRLVLGAGLALTVTGPGAAVVVLSNGNEHCTVQTDHYRLVVDTAAPVARARWRGADGPGPIGLFAADGQKLLAAVGLPSLATPAAAYTVQVRPRHPHLHTLRSGPYLVEMYLENVVLASRQAGRPQWSGLAEVGLFCHEDRVFVIGRFLCPDGQWLLSDLKHFVYEAAEGHRACPATTVTDAGLEVLSGSAHLRYEAFEQDWGVMDGDGGAVGYAVRAPDWAVTIADPGSARAYGPQILLTPNEATWPPGSAHGFGLVLAPARTSEEASAILQDVARPLPDEAIATTMGESLGYDRLRGVYRLTAQTSGTPDPPAGLRAGTAFAVRNDGRRRRILVDQRDPWGGITGGIIRDGAGSPLPIVPQFGLNFPELNEHGEPGWATLTYPLDLQPHEVREVRGEHLYKAASDREYTYLTSLDNVGEPLLLQTTVHQCEAHTLTTGPYSGDLTFGNVLRLNDFRRHGAQIRVRSVSAVLPVFFGYYDVAGVYHGLMPGAARFRETGPFLVDYTVEAATADGAISGQVRIWEAAHADMTRLFTTVDLRANREVRLDAAAPAPLFFLRHHCFNPMAFRRFAYTAADGATATGPLDFVPATGANGEPLGLQPFACAYRADNGLDQGLPCSDITGNPGFVLLDWDVRFGDRAIAPGLYAFSTGANDAQHGDYARDVAVVPVGQVPRPVPSWLRMIPEGSTIRYSAVQMVFGDNASEPDVMERERACWALRPLTVAAEVGEVLSQWPPEVRAVGGRIECELRGGTDWVPLRLSGFASAGPLGVQQLVGGTWRDLGPAMPGEPWYNAWPAGDGTFGYTFLVKTDPALAPILLRVATTR